MFILWHVIECQHRIADVLREARTIKEMLTPPNDEEVNNDSN